MPSDRATSACLDLDPVVLITGASAGIGRGPGTRAGPPEKAQALVLTARRGDRLDQLADELETLQAGLEVLTIAADLADPATPERLVPRRSADSADSTC